MMSEIILPDHIKSTATGDNAAEIIIKPLYPGYGTTLGNVLRRVLFSSLPGGAVTAVKIKNVDHEFSTLPNVKEDVIEIILNLKKVNLQVHTKEAQILKLKVKGSKKVTAKDFKANSQVDVMNQDQVIATLTDKNAELEMEVTVDTGRGYVPVETRVDETPEIGTLLIDAIYTPVKNVGFSVEHTRVGKMTNYDKLVMNIETDGTIKPEDALESAVQILLDHFNLFQKMDKKGSKKDKAEAALLEKDEVKPTVKATTTKKIEFPETKKESEPVDTEEASK